MNFQQIKLGPSVIPHFHVILTEESISEIILFIQGRKVNFNSSKRKYHFLTNKAKDVCNTSFSWDFN